MNPHLGSLLLASCVCLIGMAVTAIWVMRDHRRDRLRARRIAAVADTYQVMRNQDSVDGASLSLKAERMPFQAWVAQRLHYNPAHQEIYQVPPVVVVIVALTISTGLARAAVNFLGPAGWLLLPIAGFMVCRWYYGWCEARLTEKLYNQFPDALAMIVRAVRVGLPVVEAIRVVAREHPQPTGREFQAVVTQTAIGVPLENTLREMAERNRLQEYRFFATALSLQSQTGGGLTETLEGLADTIRKRVAAQKRGHAMAAEARTSSYILGGLPVVTGTLLTVVNPGYMQVLFTDPSGRNLLMVGVGLLGLGAFTMRTLIRRSLS